MKKKIYFTTIILILSAVPAIAASGLATRLAGRVLLQVEAAGKMWYVNPADSLRYPLHLPDEALATMKKFALGIKNVDLKKIPTGLVDYQGTDADKDGLPDDMEKALGTDCAKADTDSDGYGDKAEISSGYSPLSAGKAGTDMALTKRLSGRILLQVENSGTAWYVNPVDYKKYFLGKPLNAWQVFKRLALGITDKNIAQIPAEGQADSTESGNNEAADPSSACEMLIDKLAVMNNAADSIRANDITRTVSYFIPDMEKSIDYSMRNLSAESRLLLANILSGAKLTKQTDTELMYYNEAYFSLGGNNVPLYFYVRKQSDGTWKIANL